MVAEVCAVAELNLVGGDSETASNVAKHSTCVGAWVLLAWETQVVYALCYSLWYMLCGKQGCSWAL